MVDQGQEDAAGKIAQPADDPEQDGILDADLFPGDAGCHDKVVAGEKLSSGNDDQTQGDTERKSHHNLRIRLAVQQAADGKCQQHTESNVGAGQHREQKISQRVLL